MFAESREHQIWAEVDRLFIPSDEIDRYEDANFEDQIKPAYSWRDELIRQMNAPEEAMGDRLPWGNAGKLRLRKGELTVWSGYNGHGKSLVLTQVIAYIVANGGRGSIASFELNPVETLKRMAAQTNGVAWDEISESSVDAFFDGMGDRLSLYTEVGDIEPHRVLAMARYVRAELNADHLVIDSLMKCGTEEGKHDQEKRLVNSLQNIAKNTGLHIHLVAHSKKGQNEYELPGKFDVSGTTMITNIADNVVTVQRNKRKEAERLKAQPKEDVINMPDAFLNVSKQRHGQWEGSIGLWWHRSGQFLGSDKNVNSYV